jgi:hypothetical protein
MVSLVNKAFAFAAKAHGSQKRKYTGEPYINHPYEVMDIVASVPHTEQMLAAALLHDVLEDTDATEDQIRDEFGETVLELVKWLTDVSKPSDGNRAMRKALDRAHIAKAPAEAKTIKLADLISNTKSIVKHDKDFAKVYLNEKALLLKVLSDGDPMLYTKAKVLVDRHSITDPKLQKAAGDEAIRVALVAAGRWKSLIDTEELAKNLLTLYKDEQEAVVVIAPPAKD